MPRRHILTERQRKALFELPTDEGTLLQHYILDDDDIEHIRTQRHARSQISRHEFVVSCSNTTTDRPP